MCHKTTIISSIYVETKNTIDKNVNKLLCKNISLFPDQEKHRFQILCRAVINVSTTKLKYKITFLKTWWFMERLVFNTALRYASIARHQHAGTTGNNAV